LSLDIIFPGWSVPVDAKPCIAPGSFGSAVRSLPKLGGRSSRNHGNGPRTLRSAKGYLDKAIKMYLQGFEADWRDAYPGINAITLMELRNPPDDRRKELVPVVRYAVQRKIEKGKPDYWDYASLLELAVLGENRVHFLALCSQIIRRILVDHARGRGYAKHGGNAIRVALDEVFLGTQARGIEILALDQALSTLSRIDARKGSVVELRYFGGLSVAETAKVLKISPETVKRDWRMTKAWLFGELTGEKDRTGS
jgi:hypothetical protein